MRNIIILALGLTAAGCGSNHDENAKRSFARQLSDEQAKLLAASTPTIRSISPLKAVTGTSTPVEIPVNLPNQGGFNIAFVYGNEKVLLQAQNIAPENTSSTVAFKVTGNVPNPPVGFQPQKVDVVILDSQGSVVATLPKSDPKGFELVASLDPAPIVNRLFPDNGPTSGATLVSLTGDNFKVGSIVRIGGIVQPGSTVINNNEIQFTTVANVVGKKLVEVTNADNQVGSKSDGFEFTGASVPVTPTVTSITPNSGATTGGTTVTIVGSGFIVGSTSVTFNGASASNIAVTSVTSLTCLTPAGAAGGATIVVGNGTASITGTGLFTYQAPSTNKFFDGSLSIAPITSGALAGGFQLSGTLTPTTAAANAGVTSVIIGIVPPSGVSGGSTQTLAVNGTNPVNFGTTSIGPGASTVTINVTVVLNGTTTVVLNSVVIPVGGGTPQLFQLNRP
jgi:hypothetical protein